MRSDDRINNRKIKILEERHKGVDEHNKNLSASVVSYHVFVNGATK